MDTIANNYRWLFNRTYLFWEREKTTVLSERLQILGA
jgi:hypothetical protein